MIYTGLGTCPRMRVPVLIQSA